ncbi:MAG: 50S ribosomal protein L13 [Chloroflexi bacterium]|nr:50S ribosomal protein L13 [Chloroflexota bacterium]
MSTYSPSIRDIHRQWYLVNAQDLVLGRLATEVARVLMGKHKPTYARHIDTGDYVVVINAAKVRVTGSKQTQKMYSRHSNFPGGFRQRDLATMLALHPEQVIEDAVKGMLPKNRLGAAMLKKLRVFAGPEHEHSAQRPTPLNVVGKHGHPSGPFAEAIALQQA